METGFLGLAIGPITDELNWVDGEPVKPVTREDNYLRKF